MSPYNVKNYLRAVGITLDLFDNPEIYNRIIVICLMSRLIR